MIQPEKPAANGKMRRTAMIVAVALFMQNLDSTVLATALPAMAKTFHADPLHMSVTLTSYLISLSVFIPASGWVADRLGSRSVFRAAIIIFTLGSIICGLAPNLWVLVAARVLQGLGGAMMLPVGRLLLLRSVSKAQMVSAMSWLTMPALIGPVLGPPLGGFIVTYASWRWVFGINVPIGILGVVAVTLFIPNVREDTIASRLDITGLLLTGLAMAALMAGFETLGRGLVPLSWTLAALGTGAAAALAYTLHQHYHPHPLLDFSLLRIATFANSMAAGSLFRIAIGALPFLLPLMLQLGFFYTPMKSGLITFASAIGAMIMKPITSPLLRAFGFRVVLMVNGAFAALFIMVCAAFQPHWPFLLLDAILLVGGFFRSLQFTAFNTIAYGDIPRERMSAATTLFVTAQQLTLTLGIVIGAATLETAAALRHHANADKADYALAFLLVGLLAACAIPICAMLKPNAGEEISGHHVVEALSNVTVK